MFTPAAMGARSTPGAAGVTQQGRKPVKGCLGKTPLIIRTINSHLLDLAAQSTLRCKSQVAEQRQQRLPKPGPRRDAEAMRLLFSVLVLSVRFVDSGNHRRSIINVIRRRRKCGSVSRRRL